MSRLYTLSPEAKQDIIGIRDFYVAEAGARTARYVLGEITRAMVFLAATPGAGHSRADFTSKAVKFWPVFSYLVVYDPTRQPIAVVRVLHGSRNLERLFLAHPI